VLPLLTAAREGEWLEGWSPRVVDPGEPPGGQGGVFVTETPPGHTVWVMTVYDPAALRVQYVRVTPGVVAVVLDIQLEDDGPGCRAEIVYTYSALSGAGEDYLADDVTEERFRARLVHWERSLDHYLATGRRLPAGE